MNNEPVAWMVAEMVFTKKSSVVAMAKVYEDEIIPLYTHPAKTQSHEEFVMESEMRWESGEYWAVTNCLNRENVPTEDEGGKLSLWKRICKFAHPAKNLSLQKVDGELVAVTYTDDEHRIIEVLWEKLPAKTLTDEEIAQIAVPFYDEENLIANEFGFARAILRKAQEK